ncbi:Uncharacterised protein [Salmonella enterica subsp. enterica]|uniref:Uncharacterized protein n=1 Tax=Salmonella enterica I TaxID=59201 RepID=A0A379WRV3_SALET|nr:Uncharacterised protein [Salmonella enterica subsp. enterica]
MGLFHEHYYIAQSALPPLRQIATGVEQALDWIPIYPEAISGTWGAELNTEQRAVLLSLNQPFCQERTLYDLDTFWSLRTGCP